jgi:hypothetical protein
MSILADLDMRGCSYESDMEGRIEVDQTIDGVELYLEDDGSVGYGAYEHGRGVKIAERDYEGDALTWYGHDHWDDC